MKQPEALRIAAHLKERYGGTVPTSQAAAELRRLDALNAELVEALEFCSGTSYITDAHEIAEEALAKAKEQT